VIQLHSTHPPHPDWDARESQLLAAGYTLDQLAAIAGRSPFYMVDRELIRRRINSLRAALPSRVGLHYAIKANPMPALVDQLSQWVDGLDVASQGELQVALNSGCKARQISMAGPGKTDRELAAAIASGVRINLESTNELKRCGVIAEQLGLRPNLSIRVNPDFELKSSGMRMSGGSKPFGIDAEEVASVLQLARERQLEVTGLHLFCGSQNLKPEAIEEAWEQIFTLAAHLQQQSQVQFSHLNIGGGLGVPYFPGETRLPLERLGQRLDQLLQQYGEFSDCNIHMELGRYLVAEAGIYACQVVDVKRSRGRTFLVTNGGLHHHLANSGNFGQVIRKNYPVVIANRIDHPVTGTVTIVGPLCTPLDIIAEQIQVPDCQPGDWVVIFQSGAYGASASPARFLGHPDCAELFL